MKKYVVTLSVASGNKFGMRKLFLLLPSLLLILSSLGQSTPSSDSVTKVFAYKLSQVHKFRDSVSPPKTLDGMLMFTFPKNSNIDGRWVYFRENAKIKKIYKHEVSKVIPEYTFYTVTLTNHLGYHINSSRNLILYDSKKSKIIQAVPIWYSDISADFLKLFIGKKFSDSSAILKFTFELQDLMIVGSTGKFENTKYNIDKVIFDLINQSSSGVEVWRHIEIFITNNRIIEFRSTNPKMIESVIVK